MQTLTALVIALFHTGSPVCLMRNAARASFFRDPLALITPFLDSKQLAMHSAVTLLPLDCTAVSHPATMSLLKKLGVLQHLSGSLCGGVLQSMLPAAGWAKAPATKQAMVTRIKILFILVNQVDLAVLGCAM